MRLFVFLLLLLALPVWGSGQVRYSFYKKITNQGALLVRLSKKESQTEALRKRGFSKEADKMEANQAQVNRNIIQAFRANYDIGQVFFFFPEHSQAIKDKNLNAVVFLNDELQPDSTIKFSGTEFLTAEFTALDQDEIKPATGYDLKNQTQFHNGSVSAFVALVLKDDQLVQLPEDYLVYVKTYESMFLRRTADQVVTKFNKRLREKLPVTRKPKKKVEPTK